MARTDYIPESDAGFRGWAIAFRDNICADPARFGLAAAEAEWIDHAVREFVEALAIASNRSTRTRTTIADKDDKRSIAESGCRRYAIDIKNNLGVRDGDKLSIGVRPINPGRSRVGPPSGVPQLKLVGMLPGRHVLHFNDSATPESRAKPDHVSDLQLYIALGDRPLPRSAATFRRKYTSNPMRVEFTQADDGAVATYYGRWANHRGETGPWSLPMHFRVAA
jgi:hypothetical protein